jgi:hypothetical protein
MCGVDTVAKRKELRQIRKEYGVQFWLDTKKSMKIPKHRTSLWDNHHSLAVIEGGGECSLEMMLTLCLWCHKKETSALKKRLAMEKKCRNHGRQLGDS